MYRVSGQLLHPTNTVHVLGKVGFTTGPVFGLFLTSYCALYNPLRMKVDLGAGRGL